MKANEFFKKVGIDAVRSYVAAYEDHLTDDLKRLVESHELVDSLVRIYKSIDVVREKASYCGCNECKGRLQAILDVESCQ